MSEKSIKILLDTNVLIHVEDDTEIKDAYSELIEKCSEHRVCLYIHDANLNDIRRDNNVSRRDIMLSKLKKYPKIGKISFPPKHELEDIYGPIKTENDYTDVQLLHVLESNIVNVLVSQDIDLHKRVKNKQLRNNVFYVSQALYWIKQTFEPKPIYLPNVKLKKCYEVNIDQDIFNSIRKDYPGFDKWFKEKCVLKHRKCWLVIENEDVLAIAIWKKEPLHEFNSGIKHNSFSQEVTDIEETANILKICTFKVREDTRGRKFGEQLLKQILFYAYANKYSFVYLTVLKNKQIYLTSFLARFGFSDIGSNPGDEIVIAKPMVHQRSNVALLCPFEYHKRYYPDFLDGREIKKYIIPIKPEFHIKLFPEFTPKSSDKQREGSIKVEISGNAIRKVYLNRMQTKNMPVGSLIFFYMSKDTTYRYSQSLTIVGVVEKVRVCDTLSELLSVVGKRSAYSHAEILKLYDEKDTPVKAINFYIAGYVKSGCKPPTLKKLRQMKVLKSQPQSVTLIKDNIYNALKKHIEITRHHESYGTNQ